ncbi:unnamed protein product [Mucor hiemalis]
MIGSVKFEDYAFDEKKKKVAESNLVLQESRVHVDVGDFGSTVQYISKQHERQTIDFGIPYEYLRNKKLYSNDEEDTLVDELVMLDLAVKGLSLKWLGARNPNYADLNLKSIDTVIITESVEILVGAVYSWLVFVDDLKGILESFQDQRVRQLQVFINDITIFLSRQMFRNFRNDVGWKLLARMRHCLRSMPLSKREQLQYRLTSGGALQDLDSKKMFDNVVRIFSRWRNWEVGHDEISSSRLFTQPFKQQTAENGNVSTDMTDEVVRFLTSSANFAKIGLGSFKFTIYEEETIELCKEENSISIGPFEFLLECLFKASAISSVPETTTVNEQRKSLTNLDGYLDVISKISVGDIAVSANPIILAFARHMILVQRVFTTKIRNLSHSTRSSTATPVAETPSSSQPDNTDFSFDALLSKVDVVTQALVSLDRIQVTAHAHELRMDSVVSGVHASALFSNPKLAPLQLLPQDRADSDTGSGRRSSNRASRRNNQNEPRLVLEAAGGINQIDVKFREEVSKNNTTSYSTLLAIMLEKANVNANISQIAKASKKQSKTDNCKEVLNVFSNIHKFYIHAPQSLLRLYGFIESWQTEQGRRYHFMFQNLVKEWEEQRKEVSAITSTVNEQRSSSPVHQAVATKKLDIKLQFLLNEFLINADLLPSLSIEYRILDFFVMVNETYQKGFPVRMYAFQLSKQVVHLITKDAKKDNPSIKEDNSSTFSIPGIRSTGSLRTEVVRGVSQLKLKSLISVEMISMSLDVGLIDSILTAQSLVGNEVSELVDVLSYSRPSKSATAVDLAESSDTATSNVDRVFKYTVDISLDGLRVSAASPSAIGMFRSNILEASISNDTINVNSNLPNQLTWKLQAKNFSLSLDHNTVEDIDSDASLKDNATYRPNCLAYILVDFSVQNSLAPCENRDCCKDTHTHESDMSYETVSIDFSRIQTVMQPIALGKLAEMYIYYDAELHKKKLMKKDEIDQLSANTKRIVQSISIKNEWPKVLQEETHSLLENKIISLNVRRLGVAIPLGEDSTVPITDTSRGVSALLFSISSIEFLSRSIEKGALQLDNIALQFVKKFDQNKAEHFIAENHPRMNQLSFPSISCHVSAVNAKPFQSVKVDAQVGGFEVDVDGTIADYINTLSIIYVKSMDRVDAFTAKAKSNSKNKEISKPVVQSPNVSEVVHLDIECKFECYSGLIRMYPKRHSGDAHKNKRRAKSLRIRTGFDPKSNEGNMATVELPGLSSWVTYQTPLGAHASVINSPRRFHADILIRESKNTLHPALVQFLREVVTGLKLGIQQSSERKAVREASAEMESNLNASLFLRLSKTQLDLSCQPSSKVVCSLGWEESEFLMNAFSNDTTSRTMSCVGSVREITAIVKHHFSPEACLNVRLDRILFNAMLTSQRGSGDSNDDISIIVELPTVSGDVNMRHLQDLLILNSCWFDQPIVNDINSISENGTPKSPLNTTEDPQSSTTGEGERSLELTIVDSQNNPSTTVSSPAPFSKHVAVCIKTMKFSVDMGQNIGKITLVPDNLSFQLHHIPFESKGLILSLDTISVISEGRLSGSADFERTVVQGRVDHSNSEGSLKQKSSICVRSDGFKAVFEYEYQNILDAIQQSLELKVDLQRSKDDYDLDVSINLEALIARLSVKTVPVIITMTQKFNDLLQKKKIEAGIRSDVDATPTKTNSKTVAIVQTSDVKRNGKSRYENASVRSQVSLYIKAVEVVIYPSQFQDSDNVDIRAREFRVYLEELPRSIEGVGRKLQITLISAALAKNVPGKELMTRYSVALPPAATKPKNLGGTKIFGIPGTEIVMNSTQLENHITHAFNAEFAGRVSVSLNIGLIKYLQEMINMFNIQLARALEKNSDQLLQTHGEPNTPISMSSNFEDGEDGISFSRKSSIIPDTPSGSQRFDSTLSPVPRETMPVEVPKAEISSTEEVEKQAVSPEEEYTYTSTNSVNFQPQLQVMGDATPPVEWLGLKRERIPGLVHENITLHLDQLVKVIWNVLESQAD